MELEMIGLGIALLIFFVLGLAISAFFLWIGTKLARISDASFKKAIIAAFISMIALVILIVVARPYTGNLIGFFLGIVVSICIIKVIYGTPWKKAFLAWVLYILAVIAAIVIIVVLGITALFSLAVLFSLAGLFSL